ncbi:S8 family serine peptidase [Lentibacillus sp. Marseille-P4043]|uniref:S8 family serine peptidase n=1 Tax=Lentibacillus sp. Marseille-P4043 TaxID=2040293 RepID=UPI00131A49C6|nr:S8 family serine peptidase [Lentibacillus sp. Marseille-P4043]
MSFKRLIASGIIFTLLTLLVLPNSTFAESKDQVEIEKSTTDLRKDYKKEKRSVKQNKRVSTSQINERRILVKIAEGGHFSADDYDIQEIPVSTIMEGHNYMVVQVPEEMDFNKKLTELREDSSVVLAEPDYTRDTTYSPADPLFQSQWYLNKMQLQQAWDVEKGSADITIAVLDSGISKNHPDLKGRVLRGYDFVNDDNDPIDDNGHGTFVSGVIAANANETGVVGIDLQAQILPVKVSNYLGELSTSNIVEGIYYAIDNGVDVINMSFGSYQRSQVEEEAIWAAYDAGIVLVAAAGNDSSYEDSYPASYPPVISVSATGKDDIITDFSNYGRFIDLAAPGKKIYSTYIDGYVSGDGTSFSAPIVSGIASLLKAAHPNWSNDQIEWAIESGAQPHGKVEWNQFDGYGRVNAYNSLSLTLPSWQEDAPNEQNLAEKLTINQPQQEKVDFPMDTDWFKIDVEGNTSVTITISNSTDTLDLTGVLFDPNGEAKIIDKNGVGENEEYTFQAKKGEYLLNIYDYYNHWSRQPFTIKVETEKQEPNNGVNYRDVSRYKQEINYLTDKGIIRGFPDGTFKPGEYVTRLQAVQMILNEMGIQVEKTNASNPRFTDITPDTYGYKAIAKAVELGFIKGKTDGSFNPNGSLTRWQMAAILVSAYHLQGTYTDEFTDIPKDHFAHDVINTLAANNITKGYPDNTFKPMNKVSREHFSVFLYNYLTQ